jgi:hypothetical protein
MAIADPVSFEYVSVLAASASIHSLQKWTSRLRAIKQAAQEHAKSAALEARSAM